MKKGSKVRCIKNYSSSRGLWYIKNKTYIVDKVINDGYFVGVSLLSECAYPLSFSYSGVAGYEFYKYFNTIREDRKSKLLKIDKMLSQHNIEPDF